MKSFPIEKVGIYFLIFYGLFSFNSAFAQLPQCDNNIVYANFAENIYMWDVTQPLSSTNPSINTISLPFLTNPYNPNPVFDINPTGLAIGPNINNSNGPALTFYTVNTSHWDSAGVYNTSTGTYDTYMYYDGTKWVDTWHKANDDGICAGGGYIYNIGDDGKVFRYDGTGDDVFITTVPGYPAGVKDLAADCEGNFYILSVSQGIFHKYSPNGVLLQSWVVTGNNLSNIFAGGGMTIIGNTVYLGCQAQVFMGVIGATTINISPVPTGTAPFEFVIADNYAACAFKVPSTIPPNTANTIYLCKDSTITVTAADNSGPPYSYVLNGNAAVTGSGPTYKVTPGKTPVTITVRSKSISPCDDGTMLTHAVTIIPPPVISAGQDFSIFGCTEPHTGTLSGEITNVFNGGNNSVAWTPTSSITAGANTLTPSISPTASTVYHLMVNTPATQGGCTLQDSVEVTLVMESTVKDLSAGKDIDIRPGEHVQLHGTAWGDFVWTPDHDILSANSLTPTVFPAKTTTYYLTGKTSDGCPATDNVTVHVTFANFPNAFSPNGDALNDVFKPIPIDNRVKLERFSVFNRWGEQVFQTTDINQGWNGNYKGKVSDPGTYFYEVVYAIGSNVYSYKGDVTLLR